MFAQTLYQIKWNTTIRRNLCIFLFFLVKLVTFISFWTERIIICRFVYWWNANGKRKTVWYYTITKVVSCCASLRFANYSFFYCCYVPGNETKTMTVYRRMAHHCQPSNSNKKNYLVKYCSQENIFNMNSLCCYIYFMGSRACRWLFVNAKKHASKIKWRRTIGASHLFVAHQPKQMGLFER